MDTPPKKSSLWHLGASPRNSRSSRTPSPSRKPDLHTENAGLRQQISDLRAQLHTTKLDYYVLSDMFKEEREKNKRLTELGRKFWAEEWKGKSGMKEVMLAFCEKEDVKEIEERVLGEYGKLFVDHSVMQ